MLDVRAAYKAAHKVEMRKYRLARRARQLVIRARRYCVQCSAPAAWER